MAKKRTYNLLKIRNKPLKPLKFGNKPLKFGNKPLKFGNKPLTFGNKPLKFGNTRQGPAPPA